ncbi:MAG: rRNA pseudouridine synthase [Chitinophagales bacterium]|nr:rRNA pseudouridine synthase [Chitinophagales bacterium]
MRLNKYLSHAGVASRRKADELIKEGKVTVNGTVVTEMGYKVTRNDRVEFEGKRLNPEKKYYLLLNKPKDFITTVSDEKKRKTVMDLIRSAYKQIKSPAQPRLYPVGRLDRNTTGVLLITNDGELAQKLTHPSTEVKKVYHVVLDKKLRKEDFDKIAEGGVVLEDGIAEVDVIAYPNPKNKAEVGVEIHTGKNRFVRRVFEALGYELEKLDRVYFAGLTKKDLPRGKWRFLKEDEVRLLKHFV